ncbi:MAG: substrate-binding domain-containing protein [Pseudolabrys sp.]|nr:substrate-binding domain-containing protein [Pseudolabrys sp.]MBV9956028.1 substrate-binding domain-containing protein [Pseudolabrys sp.]
MIRFVVAAFLASIGCADAAEIRVLSGNGARAAVRAIVNEFERETGHKVALHFEVNAALERKIVAGEEFDAVVLNPAVIERLTQAGKLVAGSRTNIGKAGLGVGIRNGVSPPPISTLAGFRAALLAAKSVAYPAQGASGVYFVTVLEKLGIAAEMKDKLKPMPAEDTVEVVARGEADLVVVVSSRIAEVEGVTLAGPIPPEVQTRIGFAAAVSNAAREPDAARAFVTFAGAPQRAALLRRYGVEPSR